LPVVFLAGGPGNQAPPGAAPPKRRVSAVQAAAVQPVQPVQPVQQSGEQDGEQHGDTLVVASPEAPRAPRNRRPYAVVAGLVISFSFFTLLGVTLISALGLPQDIL
jgi:hypothetical protein